MGSNSGKKLSLLGFAHPVEGSPFQVQGAIGKAALTRGHVLEESRVVALGIRFCITCIRIVNFNICWIKSNLLTLELLYIVDVFCEY